MNQTQAVQDLLHLFPMEKQKALADIISQKKLPSLHSECIISSYLDPKLHPDRVHAIFSYCFPELGRIAPSNDCNGSYHLFTHKGLLECYLKHINHCTCTAAETMAALEYQKFRDDYSFDNPLLLLFLPSGQTSYPFVSSEHAYAVCLLHAAAKSLLDRIGYLHFMEHRFKKPEKVRVHLSIADTSACCRMILGSPGILQHDSFAAFLCAYQNINLNEQDFKAMPEAFSLLKEELLSMTSDQDILCQYLREEYQHMRSSEEYAISLSKGLARGRADSILTLLSSFGPIPDALSAAIQEESNLPMLSRWLKLCVSVASLQEFIEEM